LNFGFLCHDRKTVSRCARRAQQAAPYECKCEKPQIFRRKREVLRYKSDYTQAKSLCCEGSDQPTIREERAR